MLIIYLYATICDYELHILLRIESKYSNPELQNGMIMVANSESYQVMSQDIEDTVAQPEVSTDGRCDVHGKIQNRIMDDLSNEDSFRVGIYGTTESIIL